MLFSGPAFARNYLVLIADDLGTDKVASYAGDVSTVVPHLAQMDTVQSLGEAGIRFTAAWANPSCIPTRASLHTGAYPSRHGLGANLEITEPGVDPDAWDMLGEIFAANGHTTGLFGKWQIGNEAADESIGYPVVPWYLVAPHPVRSGFAWLDGTLTGASAGDGYRDWDRMTWTERHGFGEMWIEADHQTPAVTESVIDWIAAREPGEPWLAVVAYTAPHRSGKEDNVSVSQGWYYEDTDVSCFRSPVLACLETEDCDDEELSVYQGLAECLDLHIEHLLTSIDDATLDDTTIVFLGDNGTPGRQLEGAWDLPLRGKTTSFESGVRVPFVIADGATWRSGAAGFVTGPGRTSSATISTTDLYATLIDDAFALAPAYEDSRSFVSCFSDTTDDCGWGDAGNYTERFVYDENGVLLEGIAAVRIGTDKLRIGWDVAGQCLLQKRYNLLTDPFEVTVLSGNNALGTTLRTVFTDIQADTAGWASSLSFCN